jgi:hypothetical protein
VTPAQRYAGEDVAILAQREELYASARARNPRRWSGKARDWKPSGTVELNPDKSKTIAAEEKSRIAA